MEESSGDTMSNGDEGSLVSEDLDQRSVGIVREIHGTTIADGTDGFGNGSNRG